MKKKISEQCNETFAIVEQLRKVLQEKNVPLRKLFLSIEIDSSKILLTIPEEKHCNDEFVQSMYPLIADIESTHLNQHMLFEIYMMNDSADIDFNMLKAEGYSFAFDFDKTQKIF